MNPKQLQNIKLSSLNVLQNLYTQDYAPILPHLHPNVTWISSDDNQYRQGKSSATDPPSSVSLSSPPSALPSSAPLSPRASALPDLSLSCQMLYSDLESCTVLCACSSRLKQEYCATLLWRLFREGPRICHIHASRSPAVQEPILTFTGRHAESFYLKPDDILYAEADNICTSLVCNFRTFQVRQSISSVKNTLPDYFLQIHRSFLVNLHYAAGLRRYALELINGTLLPIPEKRYKWLKEYLERHK